MAGVHINDLPPAARAQIDTSSPGAAGRRRPKPARSTSGIAHAVGRCAAPGCDWTGDDRHDQPKSCRKNRPCDCFLAHMIATGHHRFDIPVGDP